MTKLASFRGESAFRTWFSLLFGGAVATPGKRKLKLTAKGLAARKLQGQYMGLLRGLQPGARLRVKNVAREQGVAAAIKFADTLK